MKLTTALYFTPAGRSIQAEGIAPDIEIADIKIPEKKQEDSESWINIRESDLNGHLSNGSKTPKDKTSKESTEDKTSAKEKDSSKAAKTEDNKTVLSKDYQLSEALNLLKGLTFIESKVTPKAVSMDKNKNAQKEKLLLQQSSD